jgi:membrane protease YdiL (CAAX protease family)
MLPDPSGAPYPVHTAASPGPSPIRFAARAQAILEVLICSDVPTQFVLGTGFAALGYPPLDVNGKLNAGPVVALSLIDSVLLIGLIVGFMRMHGQSPRAIFLGHRPIIEEAKHGVPLIPAAILISILVLTTIQWLAPQLHPEGMNPLSALIKSPRDAWLFALVVIVAGGVREELQRAFLLHRFETWLGGGVLGVLITSAAFGAAHGIQGKDAMIATGLLGLFWGMTYLRRRSVIAPVISHAGFDLLMIVVIFTSL